MRMKRIVILGNAGSGKSTLARRLGARVGAPVAHLDLLFWEPGWKEPDNAVFRRRVASAIAGDAWICEGNYARRTFDLRLPRADLVLWLDTSRWTCLRRVLLRTALGRPRPDLASGCVEKLDAEFFAFLAFIWKFDARSRPSIEAEREAWGPDAPVVRLRTRQEIESFVQRLTGDAAARGRFGAPSIG
jgi:adenylate kinase family enzyme